MWNIYPAVYNVSVKYVGIPTGKAYCIAKADVSGGGGNAVISDDSQIVAIAMGNVTGLVWGMQVSVVLMLRLLHVRYFGQKDYLMIKQLWKCTYNY
jgi:hypothetical protein